MAGLGLYLHFPWCVRKCPYCDFNSHPLRQGLQEDAYRDALQVDLADALADVPPRALTTIFCGGGTPSLFAPATFAGLLERLQPWLAGDAEVTMEANPGTVEHHDFAAYRHAGINRLSLGAQSFSAEMLVRLGRIHGPDETRRAFDQARRGGFDNINLDLMYGLPEQTVDQAMADLDHAIALSPEHLSWYQLTLEPKTEFAGRPPLLASHDEIVDMEEHGLARLAAAGYRRYEISAFSRPGRECRHNLNYWRFGDYLGAGAGAHGKRSRRIDADRPAAGGAASVDVVRTRKASQPRLYMNDPTATERVAVQPHERVFEFLLNVLRLVDGVAMDELPCRTGVPVSALTAQWQRLAAEGLVQPHRIAATPRGLKFLDAVLQRFLR